MSHIFETADLEAQIETIIRQAGDNLRQQIRNTARLTCPELAEVPKVGINANPEVKKVAHLPDKRQDPVGRGRVEVLETHIATLEEAVAKAKALAKAKAISEQRRQEAETTAKQVDDLVAEFIEKTSEVVEMSERMTEQTAIMETLRAKIDDYRSRPRAPKEPVPHLSQQRY
jgi:hypothetical protein